MRDTVHIYLKLIGYSFRSQMEHRASFFMLAASHFISTFVDILGMWVLFDRFELLKGWTLKEIALIYGIIHMGFALAEAFARGFDKFSQMVRSGDFDRVLLRPLGTLCQVASREVQIMRIGRFLQGFVVLVWGYQELGLSLFSISTVLVVLCLIGTASLFYGLFILQGTLSFWTTETLELMNITTYGGVEVGQYPMTIYNESFKLMFTFIIPLACVGYYPIATLLGHESFPLWIAFISPIAGIGFLYISCLIWHLGVRYYRSTGH